MKRAMVGFIAAFSMLSAVLFAAAPAARPNLAVHKVVGVVKTVGDHWMTLEATVNGNKEDVQVHFGRLPAGITSGEQVRAFYKMIGTDRIAFQLEPIR